MAYAAVTDIEARLQNWPAIATLDGSSKPSATEVEAFILQISAEINGVLAAQGYETVPATGASDVELLKYYTATKVAALTWDVAYGYNEQPATVKQWHQDYRDFLARLRRGEQFLTDQAPRSEDIGDFMVVRTPTRDNFFSRRYPARDWDE
jgi:hypothetical protein